VSDVQTAVTILDVLWQLCTEYVLSVIPGSFYQHGASECLYFFKRRVSLNDTLPYFSIDNARVIYTKKGLNS